MDPITCVCCASINHRGIESKDLVKSCSLCTHRARGAWLVISAYIENTALRLLLRLYYIAGTPLVKRTMDLEEPPTPPPRPTRPQLYFAPTKVPAPVGKQPSPCDLGPARVICRRRERHMRVPAKVAPLVPVPRCLHWRDGRVSTSPLAACLRPPRPARGRLSRAAPLLSTPRTRSSVGAIGPPLPQVRGHVLMRHVLAHLRISGWRSTRVCTRMRTRARRWAWARQPNVYSSTLAGCGECAMASSHPGVTP